MNSAFLHSVDEVITELHDRGFFADCSGLITDSRKIGPQDVFLAVPGEHFDPRNLADELIEEERCGLVLVEYDDKRTYQSAQVVAVRGLKAMLPELARTYYGDPSANVHVIAVTGTNGKTTVTRWLAQVLNGVGLKAGVVGTLGFGLPDDLHEHTGLTTPDAVGVQRVLFQMKSEGFEWICLEASSIGLDQGRINGVHIEAAVYTNLSRDHLDYHGSLDAYAAAKNRLASWPDLSLAVVNHDDEHACEFGKIAQSLGVKVVHVGKRNSAQVQIGAVRLKAGGLALELAGTEIQTGLVGEFNAYNLAMVWATLVNLNVADSRKLMAQLGLVTPAAGRMEVIHRQPLVVVDYAHTPDALEKALAALRIHSGTDGKQHRLWALFGCGGDRDPGKRPLMARTAEQLADRLVLTSDNPRSENPETIVDQMKAGLAQCDADSVQVEIDRARAIEWCLSQAANDDVVLLAGKGHETYQIIGSESFDHSDIECVRQFYGEGQS